MIRRIAALVGLALSSVVLAGCFENAPMVAGGLDDSGTGSGSGSGSASDSGSTGAGCVDGVTLSQVPLAYDGWFWVAVGGAGAPPPVCPEGTAAEVRFLGTVPEDPSCACACEAATCATTYSTGPDCDTLTMLGELPECAATPQMPAAIDLQTHVSAPECDAVATPLPGPDAVPVSLCRSAVQEDACATVPEGFMGPCMTGDLGCPEGFTEIAAAAVGVECNDCDPCNADMFCGRLGFEVFASADCSGQPFGMVGGGDNCIEQQGFGSVRVAPIDLLDTGCPASGSSSDTARICCMGG